MSQEFPNQPYNQPGFTSQPGFTPPQQPMQPNYAQQPMMPQPPYMPPKKKRSLTWLWVIMIIAAFFIGLGVGASTHGSTPTTATTTTSSTQPSTSSQPTTAPAANAHHKINETVSVDGKWQVTINSAKKSTGSGFSTPKPGNVYVLVTVTMKNIGSSQQTASSLLQWSLRDSTGQKYTETIVEGQTAPDGDVQPGDPVKGTLAYEVPKSAKGLVIDFIAGIGGQQVSWDINV
jgi:flagellar basal body-associated protein FliL